MPPKKSQPRDLLKNLEDIKDDKLKDTVESQEGLKSPVEAIHTVRKMQCYTITESELMQLSLVNTLVAFSWSLVSGIGIFLIDISKDILLTPQIPVVTKSIAIYVLPVLIFLLLGAFFALWKAGGWRKRLIDLIKEESGGCVEINQSSGWTLQWPLSRKP